MNITKIYIPAVLFIVSGAASGAFLLHVHILSYRISLGVPPLYFPLAGVLFAAAYIFGLGAYEKQVRARSIFYVLLSSMLGMYLASLSYFYFFLDTSTSNAVPTLAASLGLGISSAIGGAVTLAAELPGVHRKLFYMLAGMVLAFIIGMLNALIPTHGSPGAWSIKLGFDSLLLCVSWQFMTGMYMVLLGGGRGLVRFNSTGENATQLH